MRCMIKLLFYLLPRILISMNMMKIISFGVLLLGISCTLCSFQKGGEVPVNEAKVTTPFGQLKISTPDFSKCAEFNITAFGAIKGDKEKTSGAIAKAIDAANTAGGGIVVIPEGEWLTKKIHLKSNVNLRISKGALLLFSESPEDYLPAVHSTWEGMECLNYSPLIYAYQCKNVAISGEGEIKAKMDIWKQWFSRPPAHMQSIKRLYNLAQDYTPPEERMMVNDSAHLRPQFIQFNRCENVLLEGITITNSPFWTIHPYLSKNVLIRKLKVYAHGHNNDGVDPEMSQNVLVEDCEFDQGDDAIAVKSGRNPEGWRLKTPSKNIVIRNCFVKNGHQLVAIGSELSGGIENVYVENCEVAETNKELMHLLFVKTNERMGGYVKNIFFQNVTAHHIKEGILGIDTDVLYQWRNLVPTRIKKLTPIQDVYLNHVKAQSGKFVARINGNPELPVKNIRLKQTDMAQVSEEKIQKKNVSGFRLQ